MVFLAQHLARLGGAGGLLAIAMSIAGAWQFRPHLLFGDDAAQEAAYAAHEAGKAAQEAFELGDFETALKGYQRVAEHDPSNGDYAYNVGVTHARLEDWEAAAAAYERALLIAPESEQNRQAYLEALRQQARTLMTTDPARAEALLEKVVSEDPDDPLPGLSSPSSASSAGRGRCGGGDGAGGGDSGRVRGRLIQ